MPSPELFGEETSEPRFGKEPQFEVAVHNLSDKDGIPYKSFEYNLPAKGSVSLIFLTEERLLDPEVVKGKGVAVVGDMPYARDEAGVERHIQELRDSANFITFQHSLPNYRQKYHFKTSVGPEDFETRTSVKGRPLKPETDLNFYALEKLRESAQAGNASFVINKDVESVVDAVALFKKTFVSSSRESHRFSKSEIGHLEDLVVSSSFNESGQLEDRSEANRNLLFRNLLGDGKSKEELEANFAKNRQNFPPFIVHQAINEMERLKRELRMGLSYSGNQEEKIREEIRKLKEFIERANSNEAIIIPEEIIKELDKHVVIHMSSFYPVFDEKTKEWVIPTHSGATGNRVGRLTVHFSVDAVATSAGVGQGKWNEMRYAVVAPLGQMIKKNGPMSVFLPADTWWVVDPNEAGVRLPESAVIIAQNKVSEELSEQPEGEKEKALFDERVSRQFEADRENNSVLLHRGPEKGIRRWTSNIEQSTALRNLLKDMYGVEMRTVGNENWGNDYDRDEESELRALISQVYPAVSRERHSSTSPANFEQEILLYLNRGLLADNSEKIRNLDSAELEGWEEMKKRIITSNKPEVLVEEGRRCLIAYINEHFKAGGVSNKEWSSIQTSIPRELARQLVKLGII